MTFRFKKSLILGVAAALTVPGLALANSASATESTGQVQSYVVLYTGSAVPSGAATTIQQAGGTVVASYSQIGVVIARSDRTDFRSAMAVKSGVEGVSATASYATQLTDTVADAEGPPPGDLPNAPAADSDTLSGLQWDMRQIHAPQAHAITGGSPAVVVGDIDTGIDANHPDLRQNVDDADSANCTSGAPVPGAAAAADGNGHGTHTAGTIAAAANGIGIVGVAPNVRIAAIKAGTDDGFFFPEAVICAFVWAGTHHIDVTNNSYFADPWLFNCKNDPVQRAIWKAEQRAIRFAMNQGTVVVSAEGNESDDLSHPTQDVTSPDNSTPQTRAIHNDCVVVPVEISGVIGVTADGSFQQGTNAGNYPDYLKSFYSSYGSATADVVAPGGDSRYFTPESVNGRILSTYPANAPCTRSVQEPTDDPTYPTAHYCYLQGTSMASPHVAGIAALVISRYGNLSTPQNGKMRPDQVAAMISQTADPQNCPTTLPTTPVPYSSVVSINNGAPQVCTGGPGFNDWYGNGQADALNAVTHSPSN
ncbi:MAG: S8 family serine peptidase [Frankiaceae bacterium]